MKILAIMLAAVLTLWMGCAMADGISVNARQLEMERSLDKRVTNILLLLQDGEESNLVCVASMNTANGNAQMNSIDPSLMVSIPEIGEMPLGKVYSCGNKKSRGFLVMRTLNRLLGLNLGTYVALDMEMLPQLIDAVDAVEITPTAEEKRALGLEEDTWALTGEEALAFLRLHIDGEETPNKGYTLMMQLMRQAAEQDLMGLMGTGKKLLSSMDTNLGIMSAVSLAGSLSGGGEHTEVQLPMPEQIISEDPLRADAEAMRQVILGVY